MAEDIENKVKSRIENVVFIRPGIIRAGRYIYLGDPKNNYNYFPFLESQNVMNLMVGDIHGRIEKIVDTGRKVVMEIKLKDKPSENKRTDELTRRLNKILKHTDFAEERMKKLVFRSLFYNFSVEELEEIFESEKIEFVKPPENVNMAHYDNTICLKVGDKYYVM